MVHKDMDDQDHILHKDYTNLMMIINNIPDKEVILHIKMIILNKILVILYNMVVILHNNTVILNKNILIHLNKVVILLNHIYHIMVDNIKAVAQYLYIKRQIFNLVIFNNPQIKADMIQVINKENQQNQVMNILLKKD